MVWVLRGRAQWGDEGSGRLVYDGDRSLQGAVCSWGQCGDRVRLSGV